jgi:hypothetical protein
LPDPIDDARKLIQSRLTEIEGESKQLLRALASLGEGIRQQSRRASKSHRAGTTAPTKSKRPPASRRQAGKRAARGQRREELLAAIRASPGARPSELAKVIGVRPTQVSVLIAKARAEKLIVKRGDGYALKD